MAGGGRGCEQEWLEKQYQLPKRGGVGLSWVWSCVSFFVFPEWRGGVQNPVDDVVVGDEVFFSRRLFKFVPHCSPDGRWGDVEPVEELDGCFPVGLGVVIGVSVRVEN